MAGNRLYSNSCLPDSEEHPTPIPSTASSSPSDGRRGAYNVWVSINWGRSILTLPAFTEWLGFPKRIMEVKMFWKLLRRSCFLSYYCHSSLSQALSGSWSLSMGGWATIFGLPSCFHFSPECVLHLGNGNRCDNGNKTPTSHVLTQTSQELLPELISRLLLGRKMQECKVLPHCLLLALIISDKCSW